MQQDNTIAALNELVSIHLAARCVNNGEFMAAMRDDAKAAVISCLPEGLSIGDDIAVRAEQNTADVMHICVPDYSVLEHLGENLTDEQLAKISGGAFEITCALSVIGVVTATIFIGSVKAGALANTVAVAIGAATVVGLTATVAAVGTGVGVGIAAGLGHFSGDQEVTVGHAS